MRLPCKSCAALIVICATIPAFCHAPALPTSIESSHGTINILLANRSGMVLVTDSRGTLGDRTHNDQSAKLFEIDDNTVCSIAGLGVGGGPTWQLQFATGGMIRSFREWLATYVGQLTFDQKLNILTHAMAHRHETLAEERHYSGQDLQPNERDIFILLAGYDSDGTAKIGKAHIQMQGLSAHEEISSETVVGPLLYLTAGLDDTVQSRLAEPGAFPNERELTAYAQEKKKDGAAALDIKQLEDLADYLESEAAHTYSSVGGPEQKAIFQAGKVILSLPANLTPTGQPRLFITATDIRIEGSSINSIHVRTENPTALSVVYMDLKCHESDVRLDGAILLSAKLQECDLYFNGGDFYRNPGTVLVSPGGHLVFGPSATQEAQERAQRAFPELSPVSYEELQHLMTKEMLQRYFPPPADHPPQ